MIFFFQRRKTKNKTSELLVQFELVEQREWKRWQSSGGERWGNKAPPYLQYRHRFVLLSRTKTWRQSLVNRPAPLWHVQTCCTIENLRVSVEIRTWPVWPRWGFLRCPGSWGGGRVRQPLWCGWTRCRRPEPQWKGPERWWSCFWSETAGRRTPDAPDGSAGQRRC